MLRSRSRSRPEPYFLAGAGAKIISYFRLRLQKIPYKNDFITTIFFSDHGIFITNIFKNNSYLLTLTSIFSIQPSKILYKRRHSLDMTDPAAFFKFNLFFISWSNSDTSCASKDIFAIVRIVITVPKPSVAKPRVFLYLISPKKLCVLILIRQLLLIKRKKIRILLMVET